MVGFVSLSNACKKTSYFRLVLIYLLRNYRRGWRILPRIRPFVCTKGSRQKDCCLHNCKADSL